MSRQTRTKCPTCGKPLTESHRSIEQNHLAFLWYSEIAQRLEGWTVREARAYCKLRFGVPILLSDASFRRAWMKVIGRLSWEKQMILMEHYPVTRDFNTVQMTQYLNEISQHFSEQGVRLTQPCNGVAA